MKKMIEVLIYADTTGLFSEYELNRDNLVDMMFPEEIVREWYKANERECIEETMDALDKEADECTFEDWITKVYTADGTDGLYEFAVNNGFDPYFDGLEDTMDSVIMDGENGDVTVFKGTYLDCRKFCREHEWEIDECELRLEQE